MYPPPPQARPGFKWGWLFAFIGIGLFGTIVFAVLLVASRVRHRAPFPSAPPPPSAPAANFGEGALDESTAVVTAGQTVITKSFPLSTGASLSIQNVNGRIHIESWDGPGIQVRITKSNGNDASRRRVPIYQQMSANKLSLRSGDIRGTGVDVAYEVKVPKEMGTLDISSTNGSIKLDGVSGDIKANAVDGSIDLSNIKGTASVKNLNGSITAVFDEVGQGKGMSFNNMNGSIKLLFRSEVNAELKASTTTGSINVDPEWGIEVKKGFVGARAEGSIGAGGQPLKVETLNGSISIMKAPGVAGH